MGTTTVEIHVRKRGFEHETITNIIIEALKISFEEVDQRDVATCDDRVTVAVTLSFDDERHTTDLSVRTAVENLLTTTPLEVISTETCPQQYCDQQTLFSTDFPTKRA